MIVMIDTYVLIMELQPFQTLEQQQPQTVETKKGIFKNCALFTNCISDINNTQVHNFKDIDVAMLMHNIR